MSFNTSKRHSGLLGLREVNKGASIFNSASSANVALNLSNLSLKSLLNILLTFGYGVTHGKFWDLLG